MSSYSCRLFGNFSTLAPTFAALAVTSLVIFVSSSFTGTKKIAFLVSLFIFGFTVALIFLYSRKGDVNDVISSYSNLSTDLRFALNVLVITVTYFGGAVYIGPPYKIPNENEFLLRTPASCDRVVDFEVPSYLPVKDEEFFDLMFSKITAEIVADLPTIYEMPPEAVKWIERMIKYTVEGGKMNRGLTVVAVQSTFAKFKARPLTDRYYPISILLLTLSFWMPILVVVIIDVVIIDVVVVTVVVDDDHRYHHLRHSAMTLVIHSSSSSRT